MHKINLAKLIMRKDLWEPVGGSDPKTVIDNDWLHKFILVKTGSYKEDEILWYKSVHMVTKADRSFNN